MPRLHSWLTPEDRARSALYYRIDRSAEAALRDLHELTETYAERWRYAADELPAQAPETEKLARAWAALANAYPAQYFSGQQLSPFCNQLYYSSAQIELSPLARALGGLMNGVHL